MPQQTAVEKESLIPAQPLPASAQEFAGRLHGLLDGQPKDEATVAQAFNGMDDILDKIAAGLYSIASMLVGEGEDSIHVVETAVETADVAACDSPLAARKNSRRALCAAALDLLSRRDAANLAAPQGLEHAATCIGDDELDSAGVSSEELERIIAGPDRDRVRTWLESLPTVLRAVAGFTTPETTDLLRTHGGPQAGGWTDDAVRELFRQGLCSLASQVLQAASH
jgi:hypothetical protein